MRIGVKLSALLCMTIAVAAVWAESPAPSASDYALFESVALSLDKHVNWSAGRITEGNGKFLVMAAVGDTTWTQPLKKLWAQKTSTELRIKIRVVEPTLIPSNSHAVIVASDDPKFVAKILEKLSHTGTLTIAIGDAAIDSGAMMVFSPAKAGDGSSLSLTLDLAAASKEGITFSDELQKRADRVTGERSTPPHAQADSQSAAADSGAAGDK